MTDIKYRLPTVINIDLVNQVFMRVIVGIFVLVSILAIFVPLNPHMPSVGLDPSWQFSINESVARHLVIGKEIVFTFGPYASIYTQSYHPETVSLMLLGSLFIGVFYAVALMYLANHSNKIVLFTLIMFLGGFMFLRDPLLFSYPLIIAACAPKLVARLNQRQDNDNNILLLFIFAFTISPLGLLPLIKGSLLLICGVVSFLIASYFYYHRYRYLAAVTLVSPIISSIVFWTMSGQSLLDLPGFYIGMSPVISGYTEAMSSRGKAIEILVYLLSSGVLVRALIRANNITLPTRIFLGICFSVFLFIAFKSGFVRHDGHAMIAGTSLAIAVLVAALIDVDKGMIKVLFFSFIVWFFITSHYVDISAASFFSNVKHTYENAWAGLLDRRNYQAQFENSLDEIRKNYTVPKLQGTTDIYSFDQSYLLASSNEWNPRPVFQSYQAYTESLAKINEAHLRGDNAPENILFRVQPIDGRMPSLEDGLSWPALFDNYTVDKIDDGLAYLRQKKSIQSNSVYDVIYDGIRATGEHVLLPETNNAIYAQIDIKQTFLGKFLGIVFKPPQLKITLKLKSGPIKDYRVISGMMKSGFFISPLVKTTEDFVFLATDNQKYLRNSIVEYISISPEYGGSIFWRDTYTLKLKSYRSDLNLSSLKIFSDSQVESESPLELFNATVIDSVPDGYTESEPIDCEGAIDVVNGWNPAPASIHVSDVLTVSGWLAVSSKDGLVPDDVFVTMKTSGEAIKYIKAQRTPRQDVKIHFKQPAMPDVGYSITVDVSMMSGQYVLGLSRGYRGSVAQCQLFKTLTIGEE